MTVNQTGFRNNAMAATGPAVDLRPLPRLHRPSAKRDLHQESERNLRKEYAELHAAIFEAVQVQRRLCAPRIVRCGELEIASEAFAARQLSGDFISMEKAGGKISLALGDISGKGLAAGMWMTLLMGLVKTQGFTSSQPSMIAAGVNRDLCRLSLGAPFVSMFLANLDSVAGTLDYCSAGHPPALLLREDGQLEHLSEGGPLLGVVPDAPFTGRSVELRKGDLLLVYSDGVIESRNGEDHEFGLSHLESRLRSARSDSAEAVLFSLLAAVQDFAGGCPQADDLSLVVVRRN